MAALRAGGFVAPKEGLPWGRWTFSRIESQAEGLVWALDSFVALAGVGLPPLPEESEPGQAAPTAVPDLVIHTPADDPATPVDPTTAEAQPTTCPVGREDPEFLVWPVTPEKLAMFLDAMPRRREWFEGLSPAEQIKERDRIGRAAAIRSSPLPGELNRVVTLAGELREQMRSIVRRYAPLEAGRILHAAGFDLESNADSCIHYQEDHFAESHSLCRKVGRVLGNFVDVVEEAVELLVPKPKRRAA